MAAGGEGHPYVCDHTDPRALYDFASWVLRRFGAPSLVACAVWGGNEGYDGANYADGSRFGTPFSRALAAALRDGDADRPLCRCSPRRGPSRR